MKLELQKVAAPLLPVLAPVEMKMISAGLQPAISKLDYVPVIEHILTTITTVFTISGQKPDAETLAVFSKEYYTRLLDVFPLITLDEITQSLKRGVYEEFGEYYGLNVKSFMFFTKSYLYSKERIAAREKYETHLQKENEPEFTLEQKTESTKKFINILYEDFLNEKLNSEFVPVYLYGFLEKEGLIKLTLEQKQNMLNVAKENYQKKLELNAFLSFKKNTDTLSEAERQNTIRNMARRIAIKDFFNSQKEQEKTKIFDV